MRTPDSSRISAYQTNSCIGVSYLKFWVSPHAWLLHTLPHHLEPEGAQRLDIIRIPKSRIFAAQYPFSKSLHDKDFDYKLSDLLKKNDRDCTNLHTRCWIVIPRINQCISEYFDRTPCILHRKVKTTDITSANEKRNKLYPNTTLSANRIVELFWNSIHIMLSSWDHTYSYKSESTGWIFTE